MLADEGRNLAYTTVMTVMDNLYKKSWLLRQRVGKGYVYEPAETREAVTARLMSEVLDGSQDRSLAFMHFVDQMSEADTEALAATIRLRQRRRRQ
jgi:predicted transcriptional regulator